MTSAVLAAVLDDVDWAEVGRKFLAATLAGLSWQALRAAPPSPRPRPRGGGRRWAGDSRVVYLTFDDGPTHGYTDEVLADLNAADAHATFFQLVGFESSTPHCFASSGEVT